jgi:3-mercaptopyruvate sulfurtransferase SseA
VTVKAPKFQLLSAACTLALVMGAGTAGAVLRAQADAPRMPLADFKKLADSGGVIVLDVRSADQFRAGHIPGAISVPLNIVPARASEWKSATKPIVTYCS